MGAGGVGNILSSEHLGDFLYALLWAKLLELGSGAACDIGFVYLDMYIAFAGYLWEVRDSKDLSALAHLLHDLSHFVGYLAGDSRVYLVKDDGRQGNLGSQQVLDGEHDTREFPSRGGFLKQPEVAPFVG